MGVLRTTAPVTQFMLAAAALAFLIQCRSSPDSGAPATDEVSWALEGLGTSGHYRFRLELDPPRPNVGEFFSVVTTIRAEPGDEPLLGATFELDAGMPGHGHGMTTRPEHRELGDGRYLSEGMKFHMPGRWVFSARARLGTEDRIELSYEQPSFPR
jgi:hypothetical protein